MLVELDCCVLFQGPDDHALEALSVEGSGEGADEGPACALVLVLLQEVDGVEFAVIDADGFTNRSAANEAEDAGLIFLRFALLGYEDVIGLFLDALLPSLQAVFYFQGVDVGLGDDARVRSLPTLEMNLGDLGCVAGLSAPDLELHG